MVPVITCAAPIASAVVNGVVVVSVTHGVVGGASRYVMVKQLPDSGGAVTGLTLTLTHTLTGIWTMWGWDTRPYQSPYTFTRHPRSNQVPQPGPNSTPYSRNAITYPGSHHSWLHTCTHQIT